MYIRPLYWKSDINNNYIELFGRTEDKSVYIRFNSRHVSLVNTSNYKPTTSKKQLVGDTYIIQDDNDNDNNINDGNNSNIFRGITDPLGLLPSFFWINDIQPYYTLKLSNVKSINDIETNI